MKYETRDYDGDYRIGVGDYSVARIFYDADHSKSPLSKEEAVKLGEIIISFLESVHPASDLDEEEYTSSIDEVGEDDLIGLIAMSCFKG